MNPTTLETLIGRTIGSTAQPLTRAAIEAWQGERLYSLVTYCRQHSPFYRHKLAAAGVPTIRGLADLTTLPLTSETELREHGPSMLCVSQDAVARIITLPSSGTTGAPKRICFTEEDLERTLEFFHIGMHHLTQPGQTVAILLPGTTPDSTGHLLARALERMQVVSHIVGLVVDPEQAVRTLASLQADVLVGFPVQLLAVARVAASMGIPLGTIRSVLLCSDTIPESLHRELQRLLGCEIFTHYGTVETGLGGGVDCAAHCGTHLREADLLFEIIDPQTTTPLSAGEWGEIVFTTLTRTGMPLLRYRTGDWGRLLPGPCPCGSTIQRLDRVLGRINHIRTLQNGVQLALHHLDELLFALPGLLDFKAGLINVNGRETLQLHLTTLPESGEQVRQLATEALAHQPLLQGLNVKLALEPGTTIHPGKRTLADNRKDTQP
ncbi:DVU_1553 family AMP-dependent CoA ligase [uncultured Desulfobulbus sp.]|uniref:DVU_1553 family AMP-dependent CoA ligase n=1 Tax=uncultured Desulfobulbus sp. TaxID=239745 RepID=UPI0029C7131A|nr:AMP-binding protein [uncultured Desulfobulbus sp.]